MRRASIEVVDYDEFFKQLIIAKREDRCLEPVDKPQWPSEIARRDIKLQAFSLIASERYEAEELYLLDGEEPWDGLFAVDRNTRTCIRFAVTELA